MFSEIYFLQKLSLDEQKSFLAGLPKPLLSKVVLGYCSKSGIDKKSLHFPKNTCLLTFFFWTEGSQFWKNCGKLFVKSLTRFLLKVRESNQKADFSKESHRKCSSGDVNCGSQLYQKSFSQFEENRVLFKVVFSFRTFPSTPRKQVCQLYPVFFCSESKHGEKLKTVSFSVVFPQNVPLEMMNANLTTLPLSFEFAVKFYIMCGNVKKILFSPKRFSFPTLFHWTREGSLTILPNVFCPNSETSHFYKCFQKILFFKNFLWTSKSHFWQACRNHFCQKLY